MNLYREYRLKTANAFLATNIDSNKFFFTHMQ